MKFRRKSAVQMFDSHAHIGEITDKALVCSSSCDEYDKLQPFRYKAAGILPGCPFNDFSAMKTYAEQGWAIGEIGLDKRFSDIEVQAEIFRKALSIAADCNSFVILHVVRAYDRALHEIKHYGIKRFMVHGFSSSYEIAEDIIKAGGMISLSPKAERLKSFGRLLSLPFVTETDMKTGEEEMIVLKAWNEKLSAVTGIDIEKRSEEMMKEALSE